MFEIVKILTENREKEIKKKVKVVVPKNTTTKLLQISIEDQSEQYKKLLSLYDSKFTDDVKKFIKNATIVKAVISKIIIITTIENYELLINTETNQIVFKQNEKK